MTTEEQKLNEVQIEYTQMVLKLKLRIETDLMRRYLGRNKLSEDKLPKWIKKHSQDFKEIFERQIQHADPNFWYNDDEFYQASLDIIEEELYKEEKPETLARAA